MCNNRTAVVVIIAQCVVTNLALAQHVDLENQAKLIPVSPPSAPGYAGAETNATSITRSSLVTRGNQQFAAYYDGISHHVIIARRTHGTSSWKVFDTGFIATDVTNSHDAISMGIDGAGYLHLSWGMHGETLKYARSPQAVTGEQPIVFGEVLSALPGQVTNTDSFDHVTYPEFYNVPSSDDLFLTYRKGFSGDGSQYLSRYNTDTGLWTSTTPGGKSLITGRGVTEINGGASVNPYMNNLAFDASGNLHISWTWRTGRDTHTGASGFQTNHNLLYAKSPAGKKLGQLWLRQDGIAYGLEISQAESHTDPTSAQIVKRIEEGSSLINNSSMSIDRNGYPLIATWWAPGHTNDANTSAETVQYMLVFFDGKEWQTSQISHRTPAKLGTQEPSVHAIGQPIVMVDNENRVIVVMRYDRSHRGDGGLQVAYSTDRTNWEFLELTTEPLGDFEPTFDWHLWDRENKLAILYQPVGVVWDGSKSTRRETAPVAVLEWDVRRYFADAAALSAIHSQDN
jgi:hypothetical protein